MLICSTCNGSGFNRVAIKNKPINMMIPVDLRSSIGKFGLTTAMKYIKNRVACPDCAGWGRFYRELVFIINVTDEMITAWIPSWNPDQPVTLPLTYIPESLQHYVMPKIYFSVEININARDMEDLRYLNWEIVI